VRAEGNRADVDRFINHSLSETITSRRFLRGRAFSDLHDEVAEKLRDNAQGMFRCAVKRESGQAAEMLAQQPGADLGARNNDGDTLMDLAISLGASELEGLLD